MTDQVFAREISPGHWQWASCDDGGQWYDDAYQSGDSEALAQQLAANTPVSVILPGQQIVSTKVTIDPTQRKHAAKLIPYELEDELSAGVEDLHFSFAHQEDESTSVLYMDEERCIEAIHDIADQGCDINTALPDYLLLQRDEDEIIMLLEAAVLTVRISEHWGFSVEQELASIVLARLAEQSALNETPPEKLKLIANSKDELKQLVKLLPSSWHEIERGYELGGFWDFVDTEQSAAVLNLRRGALSRQLPLAKWWSYWKFPVIVFGIAFICAMVVNVFGYFLAKSEEASIREDINAAYLQALPNGRLGDAEGILQSKLKTIRKSTNEPSNFTYLLSKTVEALGDKSPVKITSFSYNGDQRALQLVVEFASLDLLADFRAKLTKLGIESDSPRTTSVGDGYQARMKLRGQS